MAFMQGQYPKQPWTPPLQKSRTSQTQSMDLPPLRALPLAAPSGGAWAEPEDTREQGVHRLLEGSVDVSVDLPMPAWHLRRPDQGPEQDCLRPEQGCPQLASEGAVRHQAIEEGLRQGCRWGLRTRQGQACRQRVSGGGGFSRNRAGWDVTRLWDTVTVGLLEACKWDCGTLP